MSHDQCRNTPEFAWSGQNLYSISSVGSLNVDQVIVLFINGWFAENQYTTVEHIQAFPSGNE